MSEREYGPIYFNIEDREIPGLMIGDGSLLMRTIITEDGLTGVTFEPKEPEISTGNIFKCEAVYSTAEFVIMYDNPKAIEGLIKLLMQCKEALDE